jgi:serine/threonine-protein kinase
VATPTAPDISQPQHRSANGLIGEVIEGKYRLDAKLGQGGMGAVYRATRLRIGDEVAVKILHPEQVTDSKAAERFQREAQAAARLKHPNAVIIHDFGNSAAGLHYLVMELVGGVTLRQIIKTERALTPASAAEIITQVCAALDEAHRHGIIHRDIKPDNIMVHQGVAGLRVKVLDFGIAKLRDQAVSNLTQTGSVMGTPHYMSPEQCIGEELDSRSDIYSLGIVMYEMLAGVVPFNAPSSTAVVVQHVTQAPPPLSALNPGIPAAVEAVVMHALQKQREARPQTADDLAKEFTAATRGVSGASQAATIVSPQPSHPQPAASPGTQPTLAITPASWDNRGQMPPGSSPYPPGPSAAPQSSGRYIPLILGLLIGLIAAGGIGFWLLQAGAGEEDNTTANRTQTKNSELSDTSQRVEQPSASPGAAIGEAAANSNPVMNSGPAGNRNRAERVEPRVASAPASTERTEAKIVNGSALTESDLAGISADGLQRLRNAVFARHGRTFRTPELQQYFNTRPWYTPRSDYSDAELTSTDRYNIELIKAAEKRAG